MTVTNLSRKENNGLDMADRTFNVLLLCTGNSARSIIAEALLNKIGGSKFRAYSAGSQPKGSVNPYTLELLSKLGLDIEQLRSKSWEEFSGPGAPEFDFIITVCDNAAGETCPAWPGKPISAHWGIPDPAVREGTADEIRKAFREACRLLSQRINVFAALPIAKLDKITIGAKLREIGRMEGATNMAKDQA